MSNSENVTSRATIELAILSTRSRKPRRKIILGTIERFEKLWEICNNTVDHRIAGVPLSTVEHKNTTRENKVKRLIEQFENHKKNNSLTQDLKRTEKINKFSKESQDLVADMNNTDGIRIVQTFSNRRRMD